MTRILVIEDETPIREEVVGWLNYEGYETNGAADGQLGMEVVERDPPDLILCDIAMPVMDGHQVLIALRSNPETSHIPFIFLTAAADRESLRMSMTLGADDYITKPFTHAELLAALRTQLQKKATQEARFQSRVEALQRAAEMEHEQYIFRARLVGAIAHDFRNSLTTILTSSNILRLYPDRMTADLRDQNFDRIDRSVNMLLQMLDDLLMVAELESGQLRVTPERMEALPFVEAVIDDCRILDPDRHIVTISSTLMHAIETDPKLLRHILTNLTLNAMKYSPPESEITVGLAENNSQFEVTVEDHGIGIPQDSLLRVFEPFFRASNVGKIKGTGLGLNIVKECVQRQNGEIEVESQVGVGTRFIVRLPPGLSNGNHG